MDSKETSENKTPEIKKSQITKEPESSEIPGFNLFTSEKPNLNNYTISNRKNNISEFLNKDFEIIFLNEKSKNLVFKVIKVTQKENLKISIDSIKILNNTQFENENLVFFKFFKTAKNLMGVYINQKNQILILDLLKNHQK